MKNKSTGRVVDISKSHLGPQWQDVSTFPHTESRKRVPLYAWAQGGWASLLWLWSSRVCSQGEVGGGFRMEGDMYTCGQVMLMYGKRP